MAIACPSCFQPVPETQWNTPGLEPCPACSHLIRVAVFPRVVPAPPAAPGASVTADEAVCFFHPEKRAVIPCDSCGRLLCGLCETPVGSRRLCPQCVQTGVEAGRLAEFRSEQIRWDVIAGWPILLGLTPFGWFFAPLLGLIGLVIVIWKGRTTVSGVAKVRLRLVILASLGVIETVGGVILWLVIGRNGFE